MVTWWQLFQEGKMVRTENFKGIINFVFHNDRWSTLSKCQILLNFNYFYLLFAQYGTLSDVGCHVHTLTCSIITSWYLLTRVIKKQRKK